MSPGEESATIARVRSLVRQLADPRAIERAQGEAVLRELVADEDSREIVARSEQRRLSESGRRTILAAAAVGSVLLSALLAETDRQLEAAGLPLMLAVVAAIVGLAGVAWSRCAARAACDITVMEVLARVHDRDTLEEILRAMDRVVWPVPPPGAWEACDRVLSLLDELPAADVRRHVERHIGAIQVLLAYSDLHAEGVERTLRLIALVGRADSVESLPGLGKLMVWEPPRDTRIRVAAIKCARHLRQVAETRRTTDLLLRPSSAPTDTLLRPASAPQGDESLLLRPGEPEDRP